MHAKGHAIGVIGLGLALIAAAPARAEDPCAKFDAPLAYNACLAKQGPEWHGTHGMATPPDADAPKGAGRWTGPGRARSALHFARGRHGRMVVEFAVGGPPAAVGRRRKMR
jgi:hypothetical protein